MWLFEQTFGVLNVVVNVRMTVVKLKDGSLFVHAPVAPTRECLRLVRELDAPVRYIVLPTSAVEHKVFLGPFARAFPEASVYAAPGQWSFPLNLPLSLLGLFPRKLDGTLGDAGRLRTGELAPWASEVDHALLETPLGLGPFVEAVFYVRALRTLLVTDCVVGVPQEPPEVCAADPLPMLVRSKDSRAPLPDNTREARRQGWAKTVLFALFFQPADVSFDARGFTWGSGWGAAFDRLAAPRLLVPPILQALVLNKRPRLVLDWVERVARWPFTRIISAHLGGPIQAGPREFSAAFDFLREGEAEAGPAGWLAGLLGRPGGEVSPFGDKDMSTIRAINSVLESTGVVR